MKASSSAPSPRLTALINLLRFKIIVTVTVWCIPFLVFPAATVETLGFPAQPHLMFVRMLGWAYLALCVGYAFALQEAKRGRQLKGAIWAGVVSNGGACALLVLHGASGLWDTWGVMAQLMLWGSAAATACITAGLIHFGLREPR